MEDKTQYEAFMEELKKWQRISELWVLNSEIY